MDELVELSVGARRATPAATQRPGYRADLLPGAGFEDAAAAWAVLEAACPDAPTACTWTWTVTWLEHYGGAVDHRFAIVRDGATVTGAALLTRDVVRAGGLPIRRLHVGTAGEPRGSSVWVERNGVLTRPGHEQRVAAALVRAARELGGWDALCLPGFLEPEAAPFMGTGLRWERHVEPCWVTDLEAVDHLDTFLSSQSRRNLRRTERSLGTPRVTWAADAAEAPPMLDTLAACSIARWDGGPFADPRFTGFHRVLAERLVPTGQAWLARVETDARLLTVAYGFCEGDRLVGYQTAGPRLGVRGSPGLLADIALLRSARERGMRLYDPLGGDTEHKRRLGTHREDLVWAQARRGHVIWGLHGLGRRARRLHRSWRAR